MLVHQGEGEMKFLIPSHQSPVTTNQLYIHLAEDDLFSGYPESRSFFILQANSNRGDNLDETFMENGVLLLHAGVSPAV